MSLIKAENLEMTYHTDGVETPVLRGVSFTIEPGEFVSIMGPSGSGKSTLLHILGFLSAATGGQYYFDNKPFENYSGEEVARLRNERLGFIFQDFNLLARTSVYNNIKLPLLYSRRRENEWDGLALGVIEEVGLSHRLKHFPSQLSGGEKQRVAIARAFVNKPDVIFADEPTGNLDTKNGQKIMEILGYFNREKGNTIILITHDVEVAKQAKRIIRILDGEIASDEKIL